MFCFGSAETIFGSSFECFESKLVSKDTLFRSKPLQRPPKAAILILKMHIVWAPPGDPAYAPRRITSTASGDH